MKTKKITLSTIVALFCIISIQTANAQIKALEFFNGNSMRECKVFVPQEENQYFSEFQGQVMTIEMWVNTTETTEGVLISTKSQFADDPANETKSGGFEFHMQYTGWGRATFCVGDGGNSIQWYNSLAVAGEWAHLAFVINGSNLTVYKNGEVASESIVFAGSIAKGLGDLVIGRNPNWDDAEFFQGQITDVRIWKIARSQADIKNDMGICFTKKRENLAANWTMQEGEGTVLNNVVHSTRNKAQVILVNDMDQTGIKWIDSNCPIRKEGTTGINQQTASLIDFKTYINRESRTLTVSSNTNMQVEIYSTDGKCFNRTSIDQKGDIDVSRLPNGIYILNISTDKGYLQEKVVL